MNKGIVKGSITQLRKMKVSTEYKEAQGDTIKEDEIAKKARHTSRTAKHTYLHNVVNELPITPVKPKKPKKQVEEIVEKQKPPTEDKAVVTQRKKKKRKFGRY
jgi:hypothetical protein